MADSSSNIPQILQSQAQKEVIANLLFDAASPYVIFGRNAQTSIGLVWGFFGGRMYLNGVATVIANATLTLPANQTIYIEASQAGVVSQNTIGFSLDRVPLYRVVTGATSVTSYEDHRSQGLFDRVFYSRSIVNVGPTNLTLNLAQSICQSIVFTGALNANRTITFPTITRNYLLHADTTGGQTLTVKTAAGTGVTLTDGQRRIVECDGVNIVAFT